MKHADSAFDHIGGWATVIAAAFFLLSCILAYGLFRRARPVKTVDWVPRGLASIVKGPVSDVSAGLKLTWNDEVLRTPFSVKMRIQNTGTQPVAASDFMKSPSFDFGKSMCYEISVSAVSNPDVISLGEIATEPLPRSKFGITSPALNAGDWFEVTMVADGFIGYPDVSARVFGETRPMGDHLSLRMRGPRSVALLVMMIVGGALIPASIFGNVLLGGDKSNDHYQALLTVTLFTGMFLLLSGSIVRGTTSEKYRAANWDQISEPPSGF